MRKYALLVVSSCWLSGCITTEREKEMRRDIFNLQTRLLEMEKDTTTHEKAKKSSEDNAHQRIASANADIERVQSELLKVKGDIDALKVGVQTGQMPGTEAPAEGSLASTVAALSTRMATIEEAQQQIIEEIETLKRGNTGPSKKGATKPATKDDKNSQIVGIAGLRSAFEKKRFKQINDEAAAVLKKLPPKDLEEGTYLYAESLFKMGKMRDAALKYNDLVELKNSSGKYSAHSKMRMGDAFRHLGDPATAKLYYEELVQKHPKAPETAKAKERLSELQTASKGASGSKR
jgi:TolA-binding protein